MPNWWYSLGSLEKGNSVNLCDVYCAEAARTSKSKSCTLRDLLKQCEPCVFKEIAQVFTLTVPLRLLEAWRVAQGELQMWPEATPLVRAVLDLSVSNPVMLGEVLETGHSAVEFHSHLFKEEHHALVYPSQSCNRCLQKDIQLEASYDPILLMWSSMLVWVQST